MSDKTLRGLWLLIADVAEWVWCRAMDRAARLTDFGRGARCGERVPWEDR